MAPNRKSVAKAGRSGKNGSSSSFISTVFTLITALSLISAFYILSIDHEQAHSEKSLANTGATGQAISKLSLDAVPPSRGAELHSASASPETIYVPPSTSTAPGFLSRSVTVGATLPRLRPGNEPRAASSPAAHALEKAPAAAAAKRRPVATNVVKTLVPLSAPQGYYPESQTLTIGRWRLTGVTHDPALDSPAIAQAHGEPAPGLMHRARPAANEGMVMGLAAYPNDIMGKLERFVGTLRFTGYAGHIVLGVHPKISRREQRYLQAMNVTYYASDSGPCTSPLPSKGGDGGGGGGAGLGGSGTNYIRGTCSKHYDRLVFEWARYEMALGWIKACPECTGWMLVCDVKDTAFQRPPFADLGPSEGEKVTPDLLVFEEAYPPPMGFDNNHWFAWGSVRNCFGKEHEQEMMRDYRNKPVLCSGSTVGTREGLSRYLAAITRRYYEMTWLGPKCTPPNAVDQPVHNWLFYTNHGYRRAAPGDKSGALSFGGADGTKARAMPFGEGPVQTVGRLCSMAEKAKLKLGEVGAWNLSMAPPSAENPGLFLNKDGKPAPVVHQHDRCYGIWRKPLSAYCNKAHDALRAVVGGAIRKKGEACSGG